MIAITLVSMITMEYLPKIPLKIFKLIPSSLVAILLAVLMEFVIVRPLGSRTDTIRDVSEFTSETSIPVPFFVQNCYFCADYDLSKIFASWDSVKDIGVQGLLLCIVGSIESLMTSEVVEAYVKTPSNGQRTVVAMGFGNILSGFFGGMGGNAMIGLSTINVLNGGTSRIAPTTTALVVMAAVVGAYPVLNYIPVAALAGIMLVVVIHTFKWFSLWMLPNLLPQCARMRLGLNSKIPRVEVFVILLVTLLSIFANIAYAVIAGVAVCAMAFAWNAGENLDVKTSEESGKKVYHIDGPIFFTTANKLKKVLNPDDDPDDVEIWFGHASLMDYTAIATLHTAATEYKAKGKSIIFKSLNRSSQKIIEKANSLVQAIEYEPTEEVPVPAVPSISEGFRSHPAAAAAQLRSSPQTSAVERKAQQEERSPFGESIGADAEVHAQV
jgi:SulP family sulfate permease